MIDDIPGGAEPVWQGAAARSNGYVPRQTCRHIPRRQTLHLKKYNLIYFQQNFQYFALLETFWTYIFPFFIKSVF